MFICLTTRAIHIKLAGDHSTDDFLIALRTFISRRGTVEIIRSDNGKKFAGANIEMKACLKQLDQVKLKNYMCGKKHPTHPQVLGWMICGSLL